MARRQVRRNTENNAAPFNSYPEGARQALHDAHRNSDGLVSYSKKEDVDAVIAVQRGRAAVQESLTNKANKMRS